MAGEELVGPLPERWEQTTLGEACKRGGGNIQTGPFGSQLHAADYVPDGVPSIMPQNIGDNRVVENNIARITATDAKRLSRYLVRKGDIVYSRRGDVERRALIRDREDGWLCGTGCLRVRFGPGDVDSVYVSYYLDHPNVREWIVRHAHGATMPNLNTSILSALPFVVPPLPEQRAIAHILGTLDDQIEMNRRMNETLEAIARALFKSWFVNFDPVRAKAEGRDPGLPKPIADLFPDSFEDSELGEIPKGWRAGKVEEFATLSRDSISPGEFPDEVFDHFSIPAFDEGQRPKAERGAEIKSNKFIVPSDAVLVSKLNPRIPRIWLPVVRENHRAVCSTEFLVTVPSPGVSREFLYSFFLSDTFAGVFETLVTGTSGSHQRVKPENLLALDVVIPGEPVIRQFEDLVRPLLTRVTHSRDKSDTFVSLRNTLLPKLISGELRLKDSDRFIGRAS